MSNALIKAHIAFGEPCGEEAEFSVIADWAGRILLEDRQDEQEVAKRKLFISYSAIDENGQLALGNSVISDVEGSIEDWDDVKTIEKAIERYIKDEEEPVRSPVIITWKWMES